jgi:hypothetical protein
VRLGKLPMVRRTKSAFITFQKDTLNAGIYWTSQPKLQKDEVVRSRPAQPPIQWVSGVLSPGVIRSGREAEIQLP